MGFRRSLVRIQLPRHKPQGAKQPRVATNLAASFFTPAIRHLAGKTAGNKNRPQSGHSGTGDKVNHSAHPVHPQELEGSSVRLPEGPWYRASRDAWFVEIDGRQRLLGKHPKGAPTPGKSANGWNAPKAIREAYHRLMALGPAGLPKKQEITAAHICDLFLVWSKRHHDERTFTWYFSFLNSFCNCEGIGTLPADDVKPYHVTHWLDAPPRGTARRRNAVICVNRAFNWATAEGLLRENPLRSVKKPPAVRRERIVTPEEWTALVAAVRDQEFRD